MFYIYIYIYTKFFFIYFFFELLFLLNLKIYYNLLNVYIHVYKHIHVFKCIRTHEHKYISIIIHKNKSIKMSLNTYNVFSALFLTQVFANEVHVKNVLKQQRFIKKTKKKWNRIDSKPLYRYTIQKRVPCSRHK